jgi:hypothetical protein
MTSFRLRVLALTLLVFAAVPAFAQDTVPGGLPPSASISCFFVGCAALVAVAVLSAAREARGDQDAYAGSKDGHPNPSGTSANPGE